MKYIFIIISLLPCALNIGTYADEGLESLSGSHSSFLQPFLEK